MNIYHLSRGGRRYDEAYGFVVVAPDATIARSIAAGGCGDEGPNAWLDPRESDCSLLGKAVKDAVTGVVLRDFNAG